MDNARCARVPRLRGIVIFSCFSRGATTAVGEIQKVAFLHSLRGAIMQLKKLHLH